MTTLVKFAIAFALALFFSSCAFDINLADFGSGEKGNGNIVEEKRTVTEAFTEVHASEGIKVFITQNDNVSITVQADDNVIGLIATDIENGRLKVHAKQNIGRATKEVHVSLPNISELIASSGAQLRTEDQIEVNHLLLDGSSGALIAVEVRADEMEIEASSGANLSVAGNVGVLSAQGSSGANIRARDLLAKDCRAAASSGANVQVNASKSLRADASSGGNVSYSGTAEVTKNKSVSGNINQF
ncbi:head GIN domain-containing protein [Maribacter sp. 2307ULW6-5]|uniref:head GIN domain-containing protein n=1 Tax=Maribacter sp. 2307ULW6-5 TaxID=3386275 RepID=UPI0039BD2832